MSWKIAIIFADGDEIVHDELFDEQTDASNTGDYIIAHNMYEDAVDYEVFFDNDE